MRTTKHLAIHARKMAQGNEELAFAFFHYMDDQEEFWDPKAVLPTREELLAEGGNGDDGQWWCYDYHRGLSFGFNAQGVFCQGHGDERDFVEGEKPMAHCKYTQPVFDEARWRERMDAEASYREYLKKEGKERLLVHHDQMAFDAAPDTRHPGKRFYIDYFWAEAPVDVTQWAPIEIWDDPEACKAWAEARDKKS